MEGLINPILISIGAIFGIFKVIHDVTFSKITKHRDDYGFTKEFLNDLENEKTHTFIIEKGFRALTNDLYSVTEIKTLLSYPEPTKAILLRSGCKNIVEFDESNRTYLWTKNNISDLRWNRTKNFYLINYYICAFIPFYAVFMSILDLQRPFEVSNVYLITLTILAIFSVYKHIELSEAIDFMQLHKTHNP